jgi:hypothetical protein
VLSFVDTQFSQDRLTHQLDSLCEGVLHIDVQPVPLRTLFIALARAARERGN